MNSGWRGVHRSKLEKHPESSGPHLYLWALRARWDHTDALSTTSRVIYGALAAKPPSLRTWDQKSWGGQSVRTENSRAGARSRWSFGLPPWKQNEEDRANDRSLPGARYSSPNKTPPIPTKEWSNCCDQERQRRRKSLIHFNSNQLVSWSLDHYLSARGGWGFLFLLGVGANVAVHFFIVMGSVLFCGWTWAAQVLTHSLVSVQNILVYWNGFYPSFYHFIRHLNRNVGTSETCL